MYEVSIKAWIASSAIVLAAATATAGPLNDRFVTGGAGSDQIQGGNVKNSIYGDAVASDAPPVSFEWVSTGPGIDNSLDSDIIPRPQNVMTPDGTRIVFQNGEQVYMKDLNTGAIDLISKTEGGIKGNGPSRYAAISPDGNMVLFSTNATNLGGVGDNYEVLVVKDIKSGALDVISRTANGEPVSGSYGAFSPDGRYIGFVSSKQFVPGVSADGLDQVYIVKFNGVKKKRGEIKLASADSDGSINFNASQFTFLPNSNGIVFQSIANNFGVTTYGFSSSPVPKYYEYDSVYVKYFSDADFDGGTPGYLPGQLHLASSTLAGGAGGPECESTSGIASPDGRHIVFDTNCRELAGLPPEAPDGRRYIVRRTLNDAGGIEVGKLTLVSTLNGQPLERVRDPSFSPSNNVVSFVHVTDFNDMFYNYDIVMKNMANNKLTTLTQGGKIIKPIAYASTPVFTPSGLGVVFMTTEPIDPLDSGVSGDVYIAHLAPAAIGGADNLNAGGGDDLIVGGPKADVMAGGTGDDLIFVQDTGDKVVEAAKGGNDTVVASIDFKLPPNVENLTLVGKKSLAGVGNARANLIRGNAGGNVINAGGGADVVHGGLGDDTIRGGTGPDVLTGGAGADRFVYRKTKESGGKSVDTITDFSWKSGDRIDLSRFDASKRKKKRQAFVYVGSKRFSRKAGELRFADSKLQGDVDGDGKADFVVKLRGAKALPRKAILF